MNKENILKLAEYMETLRPEKYNQRYVEHPPGPRCGTPSCIAGHAAFLSGLWGYTPFPIEEARYWLGLSSNTARPLFAPFPFVEGGHAAFLSGLWGYTPFPIEEARYWLGLSSNTARPLFAPFPFVEGGLEYKPSPQDAAWTLRHLAETGEVRWQVDVEGAEE